MLHASRDVNEGTHRNGERRMLGTCAIRNSQPEPAEVREGVCVSILTYYTKNLYRVSDTGSDSRMGRSRRR